MSFTTFPAPEQVQLNGRQPASRTTIHGWPSFFFGLPFAGMGTFILLIGLGKVEVDPGKVHAPMCIIALFGLLFVLAGLSFIWHGLDVANVAVDLLLNPVDSNHVVELAGPKDHSAQDIINILEQILGKQLDLLPFSEGGWEEVWGEEELPVEMDDLLHETYDGLNNNKITFSGKNVDIRQGTVTLDEVLGKWVVT